MLELRPSRQVFSDLSNNGLAALWMLLGSRRALNRVVPTAVQFLLLAVLASLANLLFGWVSAQGQGHFNLQGLISYLIWPFIGLIMGIFLAQQHGLARLMLVPPVLWLATDVWVALLESALQFLGQTDRLPELLYPWMPTLFVVLFIWQSVAVLWVLARGLQWPWWERGLLLAGTITVLTVWQSAIDSQPIWKVDAPVYRLSETALYNQSNLLDESLGHLNAGVLGQTDWYFMGVAGAGYQDVFKYEIEQTRKQFDTRFGTLGRSLALINNQGTQETLPMATRTSIERALMRIGQQMNAEEDVLFLFLTSHGEPGLFELANEPLSLDPLTPEWLRGALDRAHIRWRVIVISSCYSGSFIDPLRSADALIITASAADRTSFGCTNAPQYTYFGEALFADAMRSQTSLKSAFLAAKKQVTQQETLQGFSASEPQFWLGANMAVALPRFEQRLFPQPDGLPVPP